MICNVAMICNAMGLLIGLYVTTSVLLAPKTQSFVFRKTLLPEEKWTAQDLGTLARTNQLATAVTRLTSAKIEFGAPVLEVEGLQGVIDAAAEEDIRIALLMVADGGEDRKKDPLAVFARTDNAAATCGTSDTAGGDGLDLCVDRCQRKPSMLAMRTPHRGACYTLCSLAIAPCTRRLFSWEDFSKNWVAPTKSWMASVKSQVEMQVETMTPDFNRVAAEVRTIASLVQAKGMEMAEDVAGSKTLAIISYRISVAMDFAGNSKIFKALFVTAVVLEVWNHINERRKRAEEATDAESSEADDANDEEEDKVAG